MLGRRLGQLSGQIEIPVGRAQRGRGPRQPLEQRPQRGEVTLVGVAQRVFEPFFESHVANSVPYYLVAARPGPPSSQ